MGRRSSASVEVPGCPNARRNTCERSDPVVLAQDDEYYQFGCRTCRCGYVVTAPKGVARARWTQEIERRKELQLNDRDRHTFFIAPDKGWTF